MRWATWILSAVLAFAGAALLLPGTFQRPSSDSLDAPKPDRVAAAPRDTSISRHSTPPEADLAGYARVVDGDSVYIGSVEVRLYGVDAPEGPQTCTADGLRWPCGRQAAQALRAKIDGRVVTCDERDRDSYGRVVAVCHHDGADVNAWLVRNGWAMAYRRHTPIYSDAEAAAESARRGIWRGDFVAPWDWRQAERQPRGGPARRRPTAATPGQSGRCNIKGNISYNSGRRLYHMPGDPDYANTRISVARGERWFCSEAEARAAGWKPAIR